MPKQPARKGGPGVRINADVIRAKRIAKGWSQQDLAKEAGWSDANMVFRIEKRGTASLESLKKLTDKLGITVEEVLVTHSASPSFSRGVFQLPPSLPDFTGREDELARITARLRGAGGTVGVSSALRGMGGIGKTVTAIEACWEVKDDFPDGQLVVELRGMSEQPLTPVQAMAQIIRDFHPETGKLPDDEKELLPLYRQVLTGKKALILLDDARDKDQVKSLLSLPPVAFVVTSRNALELDYVESIRLGVLPPDEALTLLRGIVGTKGTDDELRTVAEQCGWLPLALRVAGDFLRLHENWSLPKYIAALKDESKRLERLKGKTPDRDVEAVLGLSARELVRENAELAGRWQILSVFPSDFNALAAAAVWDLMNGGKPDASTAVDELTALLERSLLQFDADTDRYSLHDLMRPIARAVFTFIEGHPAQAKTIDRITAASQRFAWFYCRLLAAAHELYEKGGSSIAHGLMLFDREEINIRRGQVWAAQYRTEDRRAAELCRDYPLTGPHILTLRLSPQERIAWLDVALAICQKDGDKSGESVAAGNLGNAWLAIGEIRKSAEFYDRQLIICRELGNRQSEGQTLGNLGNTWLLLGDARKAIEFFEQDLNIARQFSDRRQEGQALGSLGLAWADLGELHKAITFYNQRLLIARQIGDRQGEANALGNLGIAWKNLGDARKAIEFYEQNLAISKEIGDKQGEANALGNLGVAWEKIGEPRQAIAYHEQHLTIAQKIGDRRGEGATLGNLGIGWADLGDSGRAIAFFEQSLNIAHETGDRRMEASITRNMAIVMYGIGQKDKAIRYTERALKILTEIESPHAEKVRRQLAQWRSESAT